MSPGKKGKPFIVKDLLEKRLQEHSGIFANYPLLDEAMSEKFIASGQPHA